MIFVQMQAMLQIMENSGSEFCNYVDAPLMQLVLKSLHHPNRFVRETCYQITALICNILSGSALQPHALSIAQHLRDGLSENWSQVILCLHLLHDAPAAEVFFWEDICQHVYTSEACSLALGTWQKAAAALSMGCMMLPVKKMPAEGTIQS